MWCCAKLKLNFNPFAEAATGGVLQKYVIFKNSPISQETPALEFLFKKVAGLQDTYFEKYLRAAASSLYASVTFFLSSENVRKHFKGVYKTNIDVKLLNKSSK